MRLIIKLFDIGFEVAVCDWGGQILTEQQSMVFMQLSGAFAIANMEVEEKRSRVIGYHMETLEDPVAMAVEKKYCPVIDSLPIAR